MHISPQILPFLVVALSNADSSTAFSIVGQRSTFVSRPSSLISSTAQFSNKSLSRRTRCSVSMLADGSGGIEELKELTKQGDKLSKTVRKTPTLFKVGGYAAVPISAILGAVITPSSRIAASAVGSAISGVAGYIGKNRLDAVTESAAKPAIAQIIVDYGLDDPEIADRISDLQELFGCQDEDFEEICTDIYKRYLVGMVKTPITKTTEMKELANLRNALSLSNMAVGEAHAMSAKEFYRQTCLFTPVEDLDDPDHPDRMSIDKFLFLSERAFRQGGETEEAFKYEMSRIAKAFDIKLGTALDRVAEVAEPFYKKALASTRSKLETDAVSSDMLLRARNSLGLDEDTSVELHLLTFAEEVKALLEKDEGISMGDMNLSNMKFSGDSQARLSKLQSILSLEDREANYEISVEATPLFQAKALAIMNQAINGTITSEAAWEAMKSRQEELLLKDECMKDLLASMIMQALGKPLEDTMAFANVNNEETTYNKLIDALDAKGSCISVLNKSGWEEFDDFDEKFCDPRSQNSACGFLSSEDRLKLYRIFLIRSVRKSESGKELSDENYNKVKEVQGLLGISEQDVAREFRTSFGPELQKILGTATVEIMGDDFTPELVVNLKEMVDKVMDDYKLSIDLISEFAMPLYMNAVNRVSDQSPSGIPDGDKTKQLDALRNLLQMSTEEAQSAHLEVFGSVYRSSVLETMGSTGIIRPEFRSPLVELRDRLGVAEDAAKNLFIEAAQERMIPMVEWIVLELERTMLTSKQLAQKRQKDFGEDLFQSGKGADGTLGIGSEANIMTDCMNLIDFYTENDLIENKEVGTKTVEKTIVEDGKEKTISEEIPDYVDVYPIKALEIGAIEPDLAELLYRQFVVGGFTNQGPQAQRYEAAREAFGGILGMNKEKMDEITKSIGGTVYENYIGNSMRTKGVLDQQDMMFLANIQGKLNISAEAGEKLLSDTQKKILSAEADSLLKENDPSPEHVKKFREKCNSMGLELETDIGIPKPSIVRMFEAEISPGLVSGEITIESGDVLSEIQDSLGLTSEEAEDIFTDLLYNRAKGAISRIKGEFLRGRDDNCADIVQRLARYSKFVNGELNLDVDENTAWKIYNMYEAMDFGDTEVDDIDENKDILKTALGLS